ncbi:MAG TPA: hypothetical protein VMH84_06220 [Xanthobacteraceae bacterium]|nr:hypothetical protein [Xanthobacteraceae bacterium]
MKKSAIRTRDRPLTENLGNGGARNAHHGKTRNRVGVAKIVDDCSADADPHLMPAVI